MVRYTCDFCGKWSPWIPSWYDPERQVADPLTLKEFDEELYDILSVGDWIEMDGFMYHWAKKGKARMIKRYSIQVLIARKGATIHWDPKDKPWGSRLQTKLTPLLHA